MTEIIPGIYQLQLPIPNNPLEYTIIYLVQGDDGYFFYTSIDGLKVVK